MLRKNLRGINSGKKQTKKRKRKENSHGKLYVIIKYLGMRECHFDFKPITVVPSYSLLQKNREREIQRDRETERDTERGRE